jgi:hypothetical protein
VGFTWVLKYGEILNFIRKPLIKFSFFKGLFKCSLCLGFWSGTILGAAYFLLYKDPIVIFIPFSSCFFSWLFDEVFELIEQKILLLQNDSKVPKEES